MEYFSPTTEHEALELRSRYGERARPLAGGTDLLPTVRTAGWPQAVISLRLLGWNQIDHSGDVLRIGAMVTVSTLIDQLRDELPLLALAASELGGPQVRNMATIGGNVVNASPAADLALCLLVLEAELELVSLRGVRRMPVSDFFLGPKTTALSADEVLRSITVPIADEGSRAWFGKVGPRSRHYISRVAVAGILHRSRGLLSIRLALGAVAPTPIRARRVEALVNGRRTLDGGCVAEACRVASEQECAPIDDLRASAAYRRRVVQHLVARFLHEVQR